MTLVLTYLAPEAVMQVSDRRLSVSGRPVADHANKAIFLDGRYIFGFTGLAELAGQRADLWFAEHINELVDMSMHERMRALGRLLPAAMKKAPPQLRRHAFIGAGFARMGSDAPIEPMAVQLSNFLKRTGQPSNWPSQEFEVVVRRIPPGKAFQLVGAGAKLNVSERADLLRTIRKARKAGAGIQAIARIMAEMIWKVANRDATVGHTAMICSLPRSALGANGEAAQGVSGGIGFNSNDAAFYYLGPEAAEGTFFGPTIVSPGMISTDLEMRFGTADEPPLPPRGIAAIHYQGPGGTKTPADAPCPCGSGNPYKGCHDKT